MSSLTKNNRILVVEDEETLAMGLEFNLREEGYDVVWAADGRQALEFFEKDTFDLIILDLMLPYYDGFEIAERIRNQAPQMPLLMLTARTAAADRVRGLQLGADDYLTKPFHLPELLLRVKGMLRRKDWYREITDTNTVYQFGDNIIDFRNLTCKVGNKDFQLTMHEAMVIKYLIDHKGEVVSRKALLENVWQVHSDIETRTVDNFIARLRKYFEPNPAKPIFIKSIRSAGYIFDDGQRDGDETEAMIGDEE